MAQVSELPCDGDGVCMVCKQKPAEAEVLACKTCVTPWHVACLTSARPQTLADTAHWECPDCSDLSCAAPAVSGGGLVEKIRAIEADASLTDLEKARRRQELLGGAKEGEEAEGKGKETDGEGAGGVLGILGDQFNCSICMQLLDRPVSTPCGHNFCLKCFQKWTGQQRMKTCAICRKMIPVKMAKEPRINSAIVMAIRMAKASQSNSSVGPAKISHFIHNQDRPDKAFTTERAKKTGKANACSGKIFVTIPSDFLGPITPEYDPTRGLGVMVGETWEDRMECRQWGAHFPHVAGIGGQSNHGAQSVALSGGYEDDEDHGEWFLYTGSGGRDLTGNKRTNKKQSFDQSFKSSNEALRVSCREGYPVRVVRSHKEKRSSYAPEGGVRYDGVYRIEKCWRKAGLQGFVVCRYLFVRCDNDPAPWTIDTQGDRPRPLPSIPELKQAKDITERKKSPAWDFDEQKGVWTWTRPQPPSQKTLVDGDKVKITKRKNRSGTGSVKEKLLKEFSCLICRKVMVQPLTTPCAHNFCKACLEGAFAGQSHVKERKNGGRTLRAQKNVMKCPSCPQDISEFLQNPQVNRELMNVIETLQNQLEEENSKAKETEDAQSLSSSENADGEGSEVEMREDADSIDEDAVSVSKRRKLSNDGAEAGEADGAKDDEVGKPGRLADGEESTEVNVQESADSMDETPDFVAENKENCDVNAESLKGDKAEKPSNDSIVLPASPQKKPDAGVPEACEPAKRGRGRPKKVSAQNNSGVN
ncbi:E3 ubiquitin-protein ligase ORTHRUS 2-like [Salvia hispanica]|uniref:E3 ubiquitin-protein ligase ORTHRUS 2-like n=1 Tax=Salvia hispanica TaxID=49212 RepID=UPI0020091C4D|nr:E3 ubiquitin-protein ligase ORTHRUS 2-like [Salvia hispanica]